MKANSNKGVFIARKKDNSIYYRTSITYKGKHISLGSFDLEEAACKCYDSAWEVLNNPQITLEDFSSKYEIPFPKWVVLINFRDNGLYCSNPIYLKTSFFNYYLSPNKVLKFDKDDLFYYSSHKIMARGNHLFVADYGIQTNVLTRYGIPSYGVLNRDYRFKNNDPLDFRYGNIEIINKYRGVSSVSENGKTLYHVKIHVNGYLKVGTYLTENEAAIAYNKAADELIRKGYSKNFATNYIVDLSPKEYAEIYSKIKISPGIMNL